MNFQFLQCLDRLHKRILVWNFSILFFYIALRLNEALRNSLQWLFIQVIDIYFLRFSD